MATQKLSKREINQRKTIRNAEKFINELFYANGFFFSGGEFPDAVEKLNNRNPIAGIADYEAACNWFNDVFMPVWRKIRNNRNIDIVRKARNIRRQYLEKMNKTINGEFGVVFSNSNLPWGAVKEFNESFEFFLRVRAEG
jgi:hypothetical protein